MAQHGKAQDGNAQAGKAQDGMKPAAKQTDPSVEGEQRLSGHGLVAGRHRVLLLMPGGPLLFEFSCAIDGLPLETQHAAILAGYRRQADSDGDGRVTWDELLSNDALRAAFLSDAQLDSDETRAAFLRSYDLNRNREVDDDEWPRVFRQTSTRGRTFAVLNRDDDRDWNREQSPLFTVLDVNNDQRLDAAECRGARAVLRQLDADDDERLTQAEISASRVETAGMPTQSVRRSLEPALAWDVSSRTDWEALLAALQGVYGAGGPLKAGCFPLRPAFFAQLDRDRNQRLSRRELEALVALPPTASWSIDWPQTSSVSPAMAAAASVPRPTAEPSVPASGNRPAVQRTGRLALSSWQADGESLDPPMLDPSGEIWRLAAGELRMAIFSLNNPGSGNEAAQVRVVAGFPPDALWTVADMDADGQLLGREIELFESRLLTLDRDQSGTVSRDELPELVWLAVVRGSTPAGVIRPPARRSRPSLAASAPGVGARASSNANGTPSAVADGVSNDAAPPWFDSLDANGDGLISQREFPGERSLFERLDTDRDGQLTLQEANQK